MAVEERDAQLALQRGDLAADGGLAHPQRLAGVREAAGLGRGVEDAELVPVHGVSRGGRYSAAKAPVAQFSRTLAVELAPDRVRVNCVAPDLAPTPNMIGISGDGETGQHPMLDPLNVSVSIPMGRLGTPSDISNAVVFLASGLSSYLTGTTLHPDGGTFACSGWFNWPGTGYGNMLPPDVLDAMRETS